MCTPHLKFVVRAQALESDFLGSNLESSPYELCDCGQSTYHLLPSSFICTIEIWLHLPYMVDVRIKQIGLRTVSLSYTKHRIVLTITKKLELTFTEF